MNILKTERLILRNLVPGDLDSLFALYGDPDVVEHIPDAPRTYDEAREELLFHMNGHPKNPELGLWAAVHKETSAFIGQFGLLPCTVDGKDEIEIAFVLSRAYWGQGLGKEAAQALVDYGFEKLNVTRLVCLMSPHNRAAIRLSEKIGMAFEKDGADEAGPYVMASIHKPRRTIT